MKKFNIQKQGYSIIEVENYIDSIEKSYNTQLQEQKIRIFELKKELDSVNSKLNEYKQKDSNISGALIAAVETAKKIENSSKNVYELEIKRVRSLYNKWESFLNDLMAKYPQMKEQYDTQKVLNAFSNSIDKVLEMNSQSMGEVEPNSNRIGIRNLIYKMSNVPTLNSGSMYKKNDEIKKIKRNTRPTKESAMEFETYNSYVAETNRVENLNNKIKPIAKLQIDDDEQYDSLVDKFLNDELPEELATSGYSKAIINRSKRYKPSLYPEPNESGFDLKEALNPTDDLLEIMKSFEEDND